MLPTDLLQFEMLKQNWEALTDEQASFLDEDLIDVLRYLNSRTDLVSVSSCATHLEELTANGTQRPRWHKWDFYIHFAATSSGTEYLAQLYHSLAIQCEQDYNQTYFEERGSFEGLQRGPARLLSGPMWPKFIRLTNVTMGLPADLKSPNESNWYQATTLAASLSGTPENRAWWLAMFKDKVFSEKES